MKELKETDTQTMTRMLDNEVTELKLVNGAVFVYRKKMWQKLRKSVRTNIHVPKDNV